jgi:hypothetical protein
MNVLLSSASPRHKRHVCRNIHAHTAATYAPRDKTAPSRATERGCPVMTRARATAARLNPASLATASSWSKGREFLLWVSLLPKILQGPTLCNCASNCASLFFIYFYLFLFSSYSLFSSSLTHTPYIRMHTDMHPPFGKAAVDAFSFCGFLSFFLSFRFQFLPVLFFFSFSLFVGGRGVSALADTMVSSPRSCIV